VQLRLHDEASIVGEDKKLALSRSVPRHPTSVSIASPNSMRLLCWIKCRLIRRAAAPLTAFGPLEPHGSNGVQLRDFASIASSDCG
jgi:hypothetical protein